MADEVVSTELAHNAVGFWRSLAQPVAIQAPVLGAALLTATIAGITGASGPLSFLLGIVAGLFLVVIFVELARNMASAGAVYGFMGVMAGVNVAFVIGWLYACMMILFAGATISATADFFNSSIQTASPSASIPWLIIAVITWILSFFLASRRISISTAVLLVIEAIGSALIIVVGVIVLSKGGYHGNHFGFQYFTFNGTDIGHVFLGIVIAFLGFGGFESAAIFGEEANRPRAVIPRTMLVALLFSGGIYVFAAWFESVGFKDTATLAGSPSPLVQVTQTYVNTAIAVILGFAATVSAFSATLANINQGTRYLYSLGRDGFISGRLAQTDPTEKSPIGALLIMAPLALVLSVGFFWTNPGNAFAYISTIGGLIYTFIYLIVSVTSIWYFARKHQPFFVGISVISSGILGYALYSSLYPPPTYPFNLLPYAALVLILAGVVIIGIDPKLRARLANGPTFKVAVIQEEPLEVGSPVKTASHIEFRG